MRKLADKLNKLAATVGIIFLVMMLIIVSIQVITRLTIKTTPRWAEEVSKILLVWFGFLGLTVGVKEKFHISITFFRSKLNKTGKKVIDIIIEAVMIFFGYGLLWYGSQLVYETRRSTLPATKWPAYVPYAVLPVAGFLIILYCTIHLIDIFKNKDKSIDKMEVEK